MKDKDWENWLIGREGTLYGDMKRDTMKNSNPPISTNYTTKASNNQKQTSTYIPSSATRTKEEIHYDQEDSIATIIFLGIIGLATFGWFTNPEAQTVEWYWYFGVSLAFAFVIDWLLKNWFRFILTLIRIAIKLILYLVLIGAIIGGLYYFFDK
tara:strand:+ start:2315 stop:2776 length:462 start_codon:yes stop_codon:yes gene_type:complete